MGMGIPHPLTIMCRPVISRDMNSYGILAVVAVAIAVSAVCCAAFELDSQLYYVKYRKGEPMSPVKDRIIPIDIENVHDQIVLTRRTEDIFMEFKGKDGLSNSELLKLSGISSKGSLKRYTSVLEENGLIESEDKGKEKIWRTTGKGKKILKRMDLQRHD